MGFSETKRLSPTTGAFAYVSRAATERALEALDRWAAEPDTKVAVVAGPPGIGKTMLLRVFAARSEGRRTPVYVPFPTLLPSELCAWVLHALGEPTAEDPEAALAEVAADRQREGSGLVLLIDDAMLMPTATARALMEFTRSSERAIRVVLAMTPGTEADRVVAAVGPEVELVPLEEPMSPAETAAFVHAGLARAGVDTQAFGDFDDATLSGLHESSGGVPVHLEVALWRRLLEMSAAKPQRLEIGSAAETRSLADTDRDRPVPARPPSLVRTEPEPQGAPALGPSSTVRIPARFVWAAMGFAAGIGFSLAVDALRSQSTPEAEAPILASASEGSPGMLQPGLPAEASESVVLDPPSGEAPAVERASDVESAPRDPTPLPTPSEPQLIVKTGVIRPGGSLAAAFREQGIEPSVAGLIAREVGTRFDFRLSRPGHHYRLVQAADGEVVDFRYSMSTNDRVHLRLEDGVYVVEGGRAEDVAAELTVLVNVTARPWAIIEIDGSHVGETPLGNVPLTAGRHRFVARLRDGRVLERFIEVDPEHRHIVFP